MKTFKYLLEIEVMIDEENISQKYPNYQWNFNSAEEFADSLVPEKSYEGDIDMSKDSFEQFGYSIIKKRIKLK